MAGMTLHAGFDNLTEARASLEAIADGLGKALAEGITQDAGPLLATTKALTPLGPGAQPRAKPGTDDTLDHVRDMLAVIVTGGTIAIVAHHPGAKVLEWGGTITPRGVPIHFKEHAMARRAAVQELPDIEHAVEDRINQLTQT